MTDVMRFFWRSMSIAKTQVGEPFSLSFGGWDRSRDKTSRSKVTAESKTRPAPKPLATEIVRSNPEVTLSLAPGAVIFKKLTSRIRIVAITGDPVKTGIADSLAPGRPGAEADQCCGLVMKES
jgi:hypothetical protein